MQIPKFLQPGQLAKLNNELISSTGCFGFLDVESYALSVLPENNADAFFRYSVALYCVYHDQGCQFLNFFLDPSNCPSTTLSYQTKFHFLHKKAVELTLRPAFTHGMVRNSVSNGFQSKMQNYFTQKHGATNFPGINQYLITLSDLDWKYATENLVKDADSFYDYLFQWAREFQHSNTSITELQVTFADSIYFQKSIDIRVCQSLYGNSSHPSDYIDWTQEKKLHLNSWQENIKRSFKSGNIKDNRVFCRLLVDIMASDLDKPKNSTACAKKYGFGIPM